MNKKLIAAAVSAAVVAPVAAYGETTVYGRINNALDLNDLSSAADADGTTDISTVSSRFGIKYSQSMGNGLTAHGKYEFGTTTDKESGKSYVRSDNANKSGTTGVDDIRVATVGISGAFGSVNVGNQWSAYFNTFGTLVSPTYTLGYYLYSSVGGAPFRTSNTIKYSNSYGSLYLELDVRFNGSNEGGAVAEKISGDGIGLGLSFAVNDNLTIAASFDNESGADGAGTDPDGPDTDRVGFGAKYAFGGGYWISAGMQSYELDDDKSTPDDDGAEVDTTIVYVGGNFSEKTNWLFGLSSADDGDDKATPKTDDSSQMTWGVYHSLGGGLKLFYEAASVDSENSGYDGARHLLGMRVDF